MWLRPADIAVRRGFPHRDVRGGLGHTTFETARGSLSRRSAQQCSKSRQAGAQQMHPHTTRRRGAHTVCRNSSHASGTPPHATQASRVELLVDAHGEPHVELDDVRLLVVTGGVAGELEDLDHPRCCMRRYEGGQRWSPPDFESPGGSCSGVCLLLQDLLQSCARGGGGEWRTCAMRYDEPRLVWTRLTTTH